MTQLDRAKQRLFGADGLQAANVKPFVGAGRDTTPDQMAGAIDQALARIEAGDYELVTRFDD